MTSKSNTPKEQPNTWPRGGQAKSSDVAATMAKFLDSQAEPAEVSGKRPTMNDTRISALKMVLLGLDEVQGLGGLLPEADPEAAGDVAPGTFLDLVKQYGGKRIPESDLVVVIDAIAPLFPTYQWLWK
jgi:hypothetical protein